MPEPTLTMPEFTLWSISNCCKNWFFRLSMLMISYSKREILSLSRRIFFGMNLLASSLVNSTINPIPMSKLNLEVSLFQSQQNPNFSTFQNLTIRHSCIDHRTPLRAILCSPVASFENFSLSRN